MRSRPTAVRVVEVGPRDGLQSITPTVPTKTKVQFINALSKAKIPEIEVTSFVSPKWVPQLSDAMEVSATIDHDPHTIYTALVPNLEGFHRALSTGYSSITVFTAASNTFSQKNINCNIDESLERIRAISREVGNNNLRFRAYISTVWYCPYDGFMDIENTIIIIQALVDMGVQEISLGDTVGKASTSDVSYALDLILEKFDRGLFALHFHDTYNHALENIKVGLDYGIATFDASAGGIGGCPYAPGAMGNVSTNAVVDLCNQLKIVTGINESKLREAAAIIQPYLHSP